jgi:hypothetical protein
MVSSEAGTEEYALEPDLVENGGCCTPIGHTDHHAQLVGVSTETANFSVYPRGYHVHFGSTGIGLVVRTRR